MNENAAHDWEITTENAGTRLDVFVAAQLQVSRGRAQKLLQNALLNGAPAKASHALKPGDLVEVSQAQTAQQETALAQTALAQTALNHDIASFALPPILYEDEHLLIVNKPRGLMVHAGAGEPQATLVDVLQAHGRTLSTVGPDERAGIVHRLDKDTSGVMAVCKTDAAHWKLASDFAERHVQKSYIALVCGVPPSPGRIEAPISRHAVNRKKMTVDADARGARSRMATTEYSCSRTWPRCALLDINLLTGRTHQIRVHLSYIHHPVVGDAIYGGLHRALECAPNEQARQAIEELHGQALHAARLSFSHPLTNEELSFETPLPDVMQRVIDALDA